MFQNVGTSSPPDRKKSAEDRQGTTASARFSIIFDKLSLSE
jgi:hypothetical protein